MLDALLFVLYLIGIVVSLAAWAWVSPDIFTSGLDADVDLLPLVMVGSIAWPIELFVLGIVGLVQAALWFGRFVAHIAEERKDD